MAQMLYAIVSKETGRIMTKKGNRAGKLGVFLKKDTAIRHAWRYGATEENSDIVEYQSVKEEQ